MRFCPTAAPRLCKCGLQRYGGHPGCSVAEAPGCAVIAMTHPNNGSSCDTVPLTRSHLAGSLEVDLSLRL